MRATPWIALAALATAALAMGCGEDSLSRGLGHGWADVGEDADDGPADDAEGSTGASAEACADLELAALDVLEVHCAGCHTPGDTAVAGFDHLHELDRLVTEGKILPGAAHESSLFTAMLSGAMPPPSVAAKPTDADIELVRLWIDDCVEVPPCQPDHTLGIDGMLAAMRTDITDPARVDLEDRRFVRYLSLAHLYDAGLCGPALDPQRRALAKAVNSLSRGTQVVAPVAVNAERTIFRIDLRDYEWSAGTWAAIVAASPYALEYTREEAFDLKAFTETPVPMVRGDWLAAMATAPPLYHEILELPTSRFALEAELDVDVLGDVAADRATRAGVLASAMATNNRLVQRHEVPGTGGRAYWLSYDFASATGTANLLAHPLDFVADVRLHVFTLANGMLAYLVTDGLGDRLDHVPDDVAIDPLEPDGDVVNGRSCLRCHDRGIVPTTDELRAHVDASFELDAATKEKVERLHPAPAEFLELQELDAASYARALARAGVPVAVEEPIGAVFERYAEDVDLAHAAAELGISTDQLLVEIGGLSAELQPLAAAGIPRDVFAAGFAAAACELGLGHTSACPAPVD